MPGTALIFGARNLGLAIAERLSGSGWNVAAAARSSETVNRVKERLSDAFAFEYLAAQEPTAWTHELVVTPRGDTFVP